MDFEKLHNALDKLPGRDESRNFPERRSHGDITRSRGSFQATEFVGLLDGEKPKEWFSQVKESGIGPTPVTLAWYQSFHYEGYGIYVKSSGWQFFAQVVAHQISKLHSEFSENLIADLALRISWAAIIQHEMFHNEIDRRITFLELQTSRTFYSHCSESGLTSTVIPAELQNLLQQSNSGASPVSALTYSQLEEALATSKMVDPKYLASLPLPIEIETSELVEIVTDSLQILPPHYKIGAGIKRAHYPIFLKALLNKYADVRGENHGGHTTSADHFATLNQNVFEVRSESPLLPALRVSGLHDGERIFLLLDDSPLGKIFSQIKELTLEARTSVSAAIELARNFSNLEFSRDVPQSIGRLESADDSEGTSAASIFSGLRALNAYASVAMTFRGDFRQWLAQTGIFPPAKYSSESKVTMSRPKWRKQRTFKVSTDLDASGTIVMTDHLKPIGKISPRIYFQIDVLGKTKKVHIGFIGPHNLIENTLTSAH